MKKYRVVVEAPGLQEEEVFEAENIKEAEEYAQDFFTSICNYSLLEVDS